MTDIKIFRVEITISEYNKSDEGFWTIKQNLEIAKGIKQLTKTLESIYFNADKYIEKKIKGNHVP